MPLPTLAAVTPAEAGFLMGARAQYYEELIAVIQTAVGGLLTGGAAHGD